MQFGKLILPEGDSLALLGCREASCFESGLDSGQEDFNGGLEVLRIGGWNVLEERKKRVRGCFSVFRLSLLGKVELGFWGHGCRGGVDDLWEAEVSNDRETLAV